MFINPAQGGQKKIVKQANQFHQMKSALAQKQRQKNVHPGLCWMPVNVNHRARWRMVLALTNQALESLHMLLVSLKGNQKPKGLCLH